MFEDELRKGIEQALAVYTKERNQLTQARQKDIKHIQKHILNMPSYALMQYELTKYTQSMSTRGSFYTLYLIGVSESRLRNLCHAVLDDLSKDKEIDRLKCHIKDLVQEHKKETGGLQNQIDQLNLKYEKKSLQLQEQMSLLQKENQELKKLLIQCIRKQRQVMSVQAPGDQTSKCDAGFFFQGGASPEWSSVNTI
jgi:hypothetical protein